MVINISRASLVLLSEVFFIKIPKLISRVATLMCTVTITSLRKASWLCIRDFLKLWGAIACINHWLRVKRKLFSGRLEFLFGPPQVPGEPVGAPNSSVEAGKPPRPHPSNSQGHDCTAAAKTTADHNTQIPCVGQVQQRCTSSHPTWTPSLGPA